MVLKFKRFYRRLLLHVLQTLLTTVIVVVPLPMTAMNNVVPLRSCVKFPIVGREAMSIVRETSMHCTTDPDLRDPKRIVM